jgi:hypothetical protein
MQLAREALDDGIGVLRSLGVHSTVLVQSDGGSDFTGEVFQNACLKYGAWIRCKVSQKGGMGVLERLNRTYKWLMLAFGARQPPGSAAPADPVLPGRTSAA